MCGIWVYLLKKNADTIYSYGDLYDSFMNLTNRGPDRSTFVNLMKYGLIIGFHRLSIMDPSTKGDQPFIFEDDKKIVYTVCNGEIYNFKNLCAKYNFTLKSGSDCEVLPHMYEKFGVDMVKQLDGEFAFCICEINKETEEVKLYVGRDQAGIRPLYITGNKNELVLTSELKGSPFLFDNEYDNEYNPRNVREKYMVKQFQPRTYVVISNNDASLYPSIEEYTPYFDMYSITPTIFDLEIATKQIEKTLVESVESRMASDQPVGCLLSGGLDSSLVASIAANYLKKTKSLESLRTFSIGMEGSTDEYYARLVADHIGSNHTHIQFPEEEWLRAISSVVHTIESYDVTTVRASTGQYLISKWISENTDIKVLLIGDGSDELCAGYMYFHNAPNPSELHYENLRLVSDIHMYDVLRADRGVSSNGLEARVPFLSKKFIELYLSIDPSLRVPRSESGKPIEKWLLRKSFDHSNYLPKEVLYRKKEAFSDGVSSLKRSWYSVLQEHIKNVIDDAYFEKMKNKYTVCKPLSKEALHFRLEFERFFGIMQETAETIPYFWLPKWVGDVSEPSARVLSVYK